MTTSDPAGVGTAPNPMRDPQTASGDGDPGGGRRVAVATRNAPKTLTCPICGTTFSRRANAGKCPVCGEQVEAPEAAARAIPVITPLSKRLFQDGNWRIVALIVLILYEIALGALLWAHLANVRAL